MAKSSLTFFNYYRRYRWRAQDFQELQDSIKNLPQGLVEGICGQSVVDGLAFSGVTGLAASVTVGIAVGPTGDLMCMTGSSVVTFASPVGNPAKSLCVIRPVITQEGDITKPTDPFNTVQLHEVHSAQVVVINGTPAGSPVYPSTQPNDVILFGVSLGAGASSFAATAVDYLVRDRLGKNNDIGKLSGYDYIVGLSNPLATHKSLKLLSQDTSVAAKSRVLVCDDETVDATIALAVANLQIDFVPGVTLTKGSAGTGLSLQAEGIIIRNARLLNFTTAAITLTSAGNYCTLMTPRYKNCSTEVDDNSTSGVAQIAPFTET